MISLLPPPPNHFSQEALLLLGLGGRTSLRRDLPHPRPKTSAFAAAYIAWCLALLLSGAISLREFDVEAAHYFSSASFYVLNI